MAPPIRTNGTQRQPSIFGEKGKVSPFPWAEKKSTLKCSKMGQISKNFRRIFSFMFNKFRQKINRNVYLFRQKSKNFSRAPFWSEKFSRQKNKSRKFLGKNFCLKSVPRPKIAEVENWLAPPVSFWHPPPRRQNPNPGYAPATKIPIQSGIFWSLYWSEMI